MKAKFDFAIIKYFIYIPISKGNPYILINRNKIDFLFLLAMQRCKPWVSLITSRWKKTEGWVSGERADINIY